MIEKETKDYKLHSRGDVQYLTFKKLDNFSNLRHCFTTRHGGVSRGCCSTWNFGAYTLDSHENIYRNFEILAEVMGTETDKMVYSAQTHSTNVKVVTREDAGMGVSRKQNYDDIDGLVTNVAGIAIVTSHSDCNSLFFYDRCKQVIGLAHSGWKGTLNSICKEMISTMEKNYNSNPADIITGIGPALCMDCFEVDEDVAELFIGMKPPKWNYYYKRGIKYYIDLKKIIKFELMECGVNEENIVDMNICNKCNNDMFFSHREQKGKRGLMVGCMMLTK